MTTDVDWRELIDRSFDDGPGHRPVEQRLVAGRRALRRRRIVVGAAAAVLAVAAGGVAVAAAPSEPHAAMPAVEQPNGGGREANAGPPDLVTWTDSGWQLAPGWTAEQRIPNPMGYELPKRSVALEIQNGSVHRFVLATDDGNCCSGVHSTLAPEGTSLEDWLVAAVQTQRDLDGDGGGGGEPAGHPVHFGTGEILIAADGVTILDQLPHPDLPASFAPEQARTAAALIKEAGQETFILVRELDGHEQVIPFTGRFKSLDDFLHFASQQYDSGEGLL